MLELLEEAATRWLDAKAAGKDTASIEAEIKELERLMRSEGASNAKT